MTQETREVSLRASRGARRSLSRTATEKRWDIAIDHVLNSGVMYGYIDDFWRYVDGEITEDELRQAIP